MWFLLTALIFLAIGALGSFFLVSIKSRFEVPFKPPSLISEKIDFEKFTSEEEFISYIKTTAGAGDFFGAIPGLPQRDFEERIDLSLPSAPESGMGKAIPDPFRERVSETTVQVKGIDEPDIIKTDGTEIYFSLKSPVYRIPERPMFEEKSIMPPSQGETKVIKAFPPAALATEAQIEITGNLLLNKNILVLFTENNKIYGYNVSNPESPTEKWKIDLENNNVLVAARLYQGKVYFVTKTRINISKPCPIIPLSIGEREISIRCTDIYHPIVNVPVDVAYTAFILDPNTGMINKSVSFVGSSGSSMLYMSQNALYATYTYYEDVTNFFYKFFSEEGQDLLPNSMIKKLQSLREYDLSGQTKMVEFQNIFEQHLNSLDNDERLRIENEFTNRIEDYSERYQRELEKTGIVKIALDNFKVLATGNVPGHPLNQFSLDEYQNHLRIAVTITGGTLGSGESANDVYILDSKLQQIGSVTNLGLGEKIYSARFIEDKGYLVTFKEIDPFFVLDLSDPKLPQVKGELKIPGYSSYLHPITKDRILGIGKEGSQVKISLFNVTSPDNPTETDKYMLDESWSDILNTHHAFLLDEKHNVFFLPGNKGGYVFSYQGDQLRLRKAVADIQARRAIYINDYLYIIGDNRLVILNEIDWEQVNQLEF
ncbi:beta-propeller domain-containing protein [Candidatus Microgenomates bacterium]|nr:beta-propeller domain-containing protein [Candidatus Microgenomates bacterium]